MYRDTNTKMTRELARHKYYRERLEHNKEIGNQLPCTKEEMWKPVCEAWCRIAPNVLEDITNSISRRITDLNKAKGDTKKY